MAKEDFIVADRTIDSLEAGDKVQETVVETPDADAAAFAEQEGVSTAAFANYATALTNHESRSDIEPLAARRAREYGDAYTDADFMREPAYNADGTAAAAPRPGTVHGDAPKSA